MTGDILRDGLERTETRARKLIALVDLCKLNDINPLRFVQEFAGIDTDEKWDTRFDEVVASLTKPTNDKWKK